MKSLRPAHAPRHFRALARRSVSLSATLLPSGESLRLVDLGLGGAGALVPAPIPSGTNIRLALSAPQLWDPLAIGGTIAWTREIDGSTRIGIRFHHESSATLRALSELLEALLFA